MATSTSTPDCFASSFDLDHSPIDARLQSGFHHVQLVSLLGRSLAAFLRSPDSIACFRLVSYDRKRHPSKECCDSPSHRPAVPRMHRRDRRTVSREQAKRSISTAPCRCCIVPSSATPLLEQAAQAFRATSFTACYYSLQAIARRNASFLHQAVAAKSITPPPNDLDLVPIMPTSHIPLSFMQRTIDLSFLANCPLQLSAPLSSSSPALSLTMLATEHLLRLPLRLHPRSPPLRPPWHGKRHLYRLQSHHGHYFGGRGDVREYVDPRADLSVRGAVYCHGGRGGLFSV